MTAVSSRRSPGAVRFARLSPDDFRVRLREALAIYVEAMRYPLVTADQRAPMWLTHSLREGWRCVGAFDPDGKLLGIAYGYRGNPGQWWHEQVRRGVVKESGEKTADAWLTDYFELTEIHVRPQSQGAGIGEDLLRRLLDGVPNRHVLLSTPEGPTRAWKLYRRVGFGDVLRNYHFAGDPRPFAILGRTLPIPPRQH